MAARKGSKAVAPDRERQQPPKDAEALVLFTDIRGFTRWSEANEVFARLGDFVAPFIQMIRSTFSEAVLVKPLGDGAMIVRVYSDSEITLQQLLDEALSRIQEVNEEFRRLCENFARTVGHATHLSLGWGVVRGAVKVLGDDYVGSNLNKSARLCDIAGPFGIVIDRDDFPDPPVASGLKFFPQTRRFGGIADDVRIWATEEIASRFVVRERLRETPEVHIAGMCIDTNDRRGVRILIAKRSPDRRLYRKLYEGCGGQLARSESFVTGVERHFQLEMGIPVRVDEDIHCFYEIKEPDEPLIPGIRFLCHRVGDLEPRSTNHSEIRWIFEEELRNMDAKLFIPKLKNEFISLLDRYHTSIGTQG